MNTIITIRNTASKGKSETLRWFANSILAMYPDSKLIFPSFFIPTDNGDFRLVIEINGKIIGVESQGDPGTDLKKRLFELVDKYNCSLIICSSRTRGDTVWAVENLANEKGFQHLWTSTYQVENEKQHTKLNKLKAKQILDMIHVLDLL